MVVSMEYLHFEKSLRLLSALVGGGTFFNMLDKVLFQTSLSGVLLGCWDTSSFCEWSN